MPNKSLSIDGLAAAPLLALLLFGPGATLAAEPCPEGARSMLDAATQRLGDDVEGALRDFELVIQSFSDSSCAAQALLAVATARYDRLGDVDLATQVAEQLVTRHPTSVWAASGHVLLGRIRVETAIRPADLEQGRELLRRSWVLFPSSRYPDLEARAEGRLFDGEAAHRLGDLDGAAESFLSVVEDEPPSRWLPRAEMGLASVLVDVGQWQAAAELLQDSVDRMASTAGDEGPDPATADRISSAERRLTIIHRLLLRPAVGAGPWTTSRPVAIGGTGIERPRLVASREDGHLLVAGDPRDQLSVIDPDGGIVRSLTGVDARGLFWSRDGQPYRCGRDGVAGVAGGSSRQFQDPDKENRPLDKLDRAEQGELGRWYVLADRTVYQLQDRGENKVLFGSSSSSQPVDLAVDGRRRLYVLDAKANRVYRLDPADGSRTSVVSGAWRDPVAVDVDSLGNVYVLDEDRGIEVFSPDGARIVNLGLTLPGGSSLDRPADLAVDGTGRVYVVDAGQKRVVVLD